MRFKMVLEEGEAFNLWWNHSFLQVTKGKMYMCNKLHPVAEEEVRESSCILDPYSTVILFICLFTLKSEY